MRIASVGTLSSHLRALCSRDNHVMKYESTGSRANSGDEASYHCGSVGCSARYNPTNGYFMLIGMPGHANAVDEPGVNTLTCPSLDMVAGCIAGRVSTLNRESVGVAASMAATTLTTQAPRAIGSEHAGILLCNVKAGTRKVPPTSAQSRSLVAKKTFDSP